MERRHNPTCVRALRIVGATCICVCECDSMLPDKILLSTLSLQLMTNREQPGAAKRFGTDRVLCR